MSSKFSSLSWLKRMNSMVLMGDFAWHRLPLKAEKSCLPSKYWAALFIASTFRTRGSQSECRPIIAERTKDLAVARSLVANGFGFSVINYRPIGTHAPDGKPLIFVPLESEVPPLPVGLLSLKGLASRSIYSAFLDLCREEMK